MQPWWHHIIRGSWKNLCQIEIVRWGDSATISWHCSIKRSWIHLHNLSILQLWKRSNQQSDKRCSSLLKELDLKLWRMVQKRRKRRKRRSMKPNHKRCQKESNQVIWQHTISLSKFQMQKWNQKEDSSKQTKKSIPTNKTSSIQTVAKMTMTTNQCNQTGAGRVTSINQTTSIKLLNQHRRTIVNWWGQRVMKIITTQWSLTRCHNSKTRRLLWMEMCQLLFIGQLMIWIWLWIRISFKEELILVLLMDLLATRRRKLILKIDWQDHILITNRSFCVHKIHSTALWMNS